MVRTLKERIAKVVQDYFSYIHDQVEDVYQGLDKPLKENDREIDNFYRQVREAKKKRNQNKLDGGLPLVSNPPYRGDMMDYLKNEQENDEEGES